MLKAAALLVAVICVVWIVVLWRWRANQRDADAGDILLYLLVLPVTVFALMLAGRWAVNSALARQDASAQSHAVSTAGAPGTLLAAAADDSSSAPWHLLAAWAHTAGGTTVDELLAASRSGTPWPRPDPELHDDDGLPVMSARIAGLDCEAVEGVLQRLPAAMPVAGSGAIGEAASPRALRALAILSPLIDDLVQSLRVWSQQWADAALSVVTSAAVRSAPPATSVPASLDGGRRIVRVLASWPGEWDDATCAVAQAWLGERLCEPLAPLLPPACWSIRGQRMSGCELLIAAERTLDVLQRQGRDDPVVLIACHSDLDAEGISVLEAQQRLFHSTRRPRVSMAGEGAAVLALSAVPWPAGAALDQEHVCLTSPVIVRRLQSIESSGRTTSADAVDVSRLALTRAGLTGAAVATFASDSDQHTGRATELSAVTLALTPQLDASEDVSVTGTITGRLEAVGPLLTLACAAAQARESSRPAVALSLGDPYWRLAAVATPAGFAPVPEAA